MYCDSHEINQVINEFVPIVDYSLNVTVCDDLENDTYTVKCTVNEKEYSTRFSIDSCNVKAEIKFFSKNAVYDALSSYTEKEIPWGSHTGVRPVSLVHKLLKTYDSSRIMDVLHRDYRITKKKAQLILDIARNQRELLNTDNNSIDVYISIPFCPSRCNYCSFSLVGIEKKGSLHGSYVDALCREIDEVGKAVLSCGYVPRSIYFGGGTPTAINPQLLDRLLSCTFNVFDFRGEVTFEAGRADTVTEDKLNVLSQYPITRININPQSMNEKTLEEIGRKHSPKDVLKALELVRSYGYDNINMDVIAGLPKESIEDFKYTLDRVVDLNPESVTVHTFALKRASRLKKEDYSIKGNSAVDAMLDYSYEKMDNTGYIPYYLYRQKNMEDNGENVGFCKVGKECVYNIDIMEENTHILAMGSGAVSKRIRTGDLIRRSDPKDIEVYIDRIDDTIAKGVEFFS